MAAVTIRELDDSVKERLCVRCPARQGLPDRWFRHPDGGHLPESSGDVGYAESEGPQGSGLEVDDPWSAQ
jgi:hypothetical protein